MEHANDNETGKTCTKCGMWTELDDFNRRATGVLGRNSECRECQKKSNKESYKRRGFEKVYEAVKAYRAANPDKKKKWDAKYREKNPDRVKDSQRKWRETDPLAKEKISKSNAEWRAKNPEKSKAILKRSQSKRNERPEVRIHSSISRAMRSGLAKGGKEGETTFKILGYSREKLMSHLENMFLPGMTWENYGLHGWHIDHKVPKVLFNFKTKHDIDFKRCWELSNLQPMWGTDNRRKHANYYEQFQPSLALALTANDNNKEARFDAA